MIYRMKLYATDLKSLKQLAPAFGQILKEMSPSLKEDEDDPNKLELLSCLYNFVLI